MPNPNLPPIHNPLVPQLTGPNYATWKTKMEMHLTLENLWPLVSQRRPRPDVTRSPNPHAPTASADPDADAQQWDSDAALATATISLHLSAPAKRHTSHITNPVTLWKTLQDIYQPQSFPARFHHWQNLSTLRLSQFKTRDGENAMDLYLDAFHAHVRQLRSAGGVVDGEMEVALLLNGLDESYDAFVAVTIQYFCQNVEKGIEVEVLEAWLRDEECRRAGDRGRGGMGEVRTAAPVWERKRGWAQSRGCSPPVCNYCEREGHRQDYCWELYPEKRSGGWVGRKRRKGAGAAPCGMAGECEVKSEFVDV